MSRTVDDRVVSMDFDNKRFESNVQTSLNTIDRLKQSLNFTGASKGLENLDAASKKINFLGLGNAVETVGLKFNAMYSIADQAFRNITTRALATAERLTSAFTIDPIKMGFSEYETQIGSVQTILANTQSKGSTLEDVNRALDELNTYADKTIYNFTEMTRNIGTFTAAGVGLEKSVTAIKGIANLAAISGSTSQQASTAMYQLSQALAAGKVSLMDWNSVVNAGMGGEVFQNALKRTATQMGYNVDALIKKYGSFRESLTKGNWLTAEVLTETLTQLSGAYSKADLIAQGYTEEQADEILKLAETAEGAATDVKTFTQLIDTLKESIQSGWTQTWEYLVGDFEEAKKLWTSISEIFGGFISKSAEARNSLLKGALVSNWDKMVGMLEDAGVQYETFEKILRETLTNNGIDVDGLIDKYGSLEEAFRQGAVSAKYLEEAIRGIIKTGSSEFNLDIVDRTLKRGHKGDDVREVERVLVHLGYNLTGKDGVDYSDDGYYGTLTEDAIRAFQEAQGLEVTGIVDEQTLNALREAAALTGEIDDSIFGIVAGVTQLGGRELIIESFMNILKGIKNIITPITEAFREIFPPVTAEQLYKLIFGFKELTRDFYLWTENPVKGRKVLEDLKNTFKGLFSVVSIVWELVKSLVGGVFKLIRSFAGLGSGILKATGSLGEWLTGLKDSVKEGDIFGKAVDKIVEFLGKVIDKAKEFGSALKAKFTSPGFEGFLGILKSIWDFVTKVGGAIAGLVSSIVKSITGAFTNGSVDEVIDIFNGGLLAGILLGIKKFIKGLGDSNPMDNLGGFVDKIKDVFDSIGESLESWQQNLKAGTIQKIAIAIGVLAVSILILSSIDPERLTSALVAITVLFADLMGSLALFDKINGNFGGAAKAVTTLIGISVAVLILASALKKIADLGWEDLAKGLVGVTVLTGVMVAAAKLLGTESEAVVKGATQMVIFAAAIKILASACNDLAQLSWEELAKGLVGVGVLMAEISIFLKKATFRDESISTAAGIAILSVAIKILASACEDFSQISWEGIGKGLAAVGALLLELAVFTKLTANAKGMLSVGAGLIMIAASMKIFVSVIKELSALTLEQLIIGLAGLAGVLLSLAYVIKAMPFNMLSVGAGFAIVSASLLILTEALKRMGGLTLEEIAKGLIALGGSMLILIFGLNAMTGALPGSAALIVAAGALAIIAPVLKALGSMSWGSIAKGLIAIAGAFAIIGIAGLLLEPLVPTLLGLAGAFALFGLSVLAIGLGITALGTGITALAVALTAGAAAIASGLTVIVTEFLKLIPTIAREIGNAAEEICIAVKKIVLALIDVIIECAPALAEGALELIAELLKALATYTPQIVDSLFDFLIGLIDGLTLRLPELIQSLLDLVVALFSGVIDALGNVDFSTLIKAGIGIGLIAALISVAGMILPLIPSALGGILGMGLVVAELAVLFAALGALAQIPGLTWLVGEGGEFLRKIGNAIGQFIGGIIGGIAEGFTGSLPNIGTDLSVFMTNLKPFLEGAGAIDEGSLGGVERIVSIITTLTAANVIDSIMAWATGKSSITKFSGELIVFGIAMAAFSGIVSDNIDEGAITAAANAGKILAEMAATLPDTGGLVAFFTGDKDLATFGLQLGSFGESIVTFSSAVSGNIDEDAITAAANAGKILAEMAAALPNTGGLVSFFTGENDLTTFGVELESFGESIVTFSSTVSGNIDEGAVTAAANAGKAMVELANTIPNTGGLVSFFTGDNDLTTFGVELESFGYSMAAFSSAVSGNIDEGAVTAAANAGIAMVTLASTIPNTGGLVDFFTGRDDLGTFGMQLSIFGAGMKSFSDNVSGINVAAVTAAAQAGTQLSIMANTIPDSGGIFAWFGGDNTMDAFATQVAKFGEGLASFSTNVSGINVTAVLASTRAAMSLVALGNMITDDASGVWDLGGFGDELNLLGDGISDLAGDLSGVDTAQMTSVVSSISKLAATFSKISVLDASGNLQAFINSLGKIGTDGIDKFVESFEGSNTKVLAAVTKMFIYLVKGVSSNTGKVTQAFTNMVNKVVNGLKQQWSSFYDAGKFVVLGFASGITANTFRAEASAAAMAKAALEAAEDELRVESPSKEFYAVGMFSGMGLANAFRDYEPKIYKAGSDIGDAARRGLNKAISRITDIIDSDMDTQPVIRPILDLSDVETGAGAINGMFGMSPSVSLMSNVGAISNMMNSRQNGGNNDVITAINDLGRKLGNVSGTTYQINGITYDDGSNVSNAIESLVRAARVERRI